MRAHDETADSLADITESLMQEFQDDLPLSTISGVVLRAREDLSGQVLDTAFSEMLQRLARTRRDQLRRAQHTAR
jgi:hypothetical protein